MLLETAMAANIGHGSVVNTTVIYSRWKLLWSIVTTKQLTLSAGATLEAGDGDLTETYSASASFVDIISSASLCSDTPSVSVFTTNTRVCVNILPEDESLHDVVLLNSQIRKVDGSATVALVDDQETWFGVQILRLEGAAGLKVSFYIPGSLVMSMENYETAFFNIDFTLGFTSNLRRLSGNGEVEQDLPRLRKLLQVSVPDRLELRRSTYFVARTTGETSVIGTFDASLYEAISVNAADENIERITIALARAIDVFTEQVEVISVASFLTPSITTDFRITGLSETSATDVISELASAARSGELARILIASEISSGNVTIIKLEVEEDGNRVDNSVEIKDDDDDGNSTISLSSSNVAMVVVASFFTMLILTGVAYKRNKKLKEKMLGGGSDIRKAKKEVIEISEILGPEALGVVCDYSQSRRARDPGQENVL